MKKKQFRFATLFMTVLSMMVIGCSKDDSESPNFETPAKKIKAINLNGPSINFTWDGDNLVKIESSWNGEVIKLSYSGNKLSRMESTDDLGTSVSTFTWDGNKIEKEVLDRYDDNHHDIISFYYTYNGGKVSQIKVLFDDDPEPEFFNFIWNGNNVTSINISSDGDETFPYYSFTSFDNKKNPLHLQFGFGSWQYMETMGLLLQHFFWSENNATGIDGMEANLTYTNTYDSDGYPLTATVTTADGNEIPFNYTYYE